VTSVSVHPSAIVEDGATIGDDTRIWHHVHLQSGARVGRRCTLGKDVFVGKTPSRLIVPQ
jgi:UDP-2-acetamido-3-amino-2,3-dideoxy-glucuronate N-acetyltransferase